MLEGFLDCSGHEDTNGAFCALNLSLAYLLFQLYISLVRTSFIPILSFLVYLVICYLTFFINDFDKIINGMFIKFANDAKLEEIANSMDVRVKIQKGLDRLEHWAEFNKMKFKRNKCIIFHFIIKHQLHKVGDAWILGFS